MKARRQAAPAATRVGWTAYVPWVLLALIVVLTAAVRVRLADVPLERDEGEYAYAGQLILQGVPPYAMAYNMKFPGTYYAYAVILAVFGETARAVHLGLLVIHAATTVIVFLLGRRWIDTTAAVVAATVFSALALDRWTMAIFAHATHFVLLPALAGFLLLSPRRWSGGTLRCALAGALLGVAVLMKQQAAAFPLAALAWVAWRDHPESDSARQRWRAVAALSAGAAVPLAVIVVLFAGQGVLGRFWFWTFQYASQYATEMPLAAALPTLQVSWNEVTKATGWMWVLAGVGLAGLWAGRWPGETRVFSGGGGSCLSGRNRAWLLLPSALLHRDPAGGRVAGGAREYRDRTRSRPGHLAGNRSHRRGGCRVRRDCLGRVCRA